MRQGQSLPTRYRLQSRQCVRIHCCLVEVTSSVKIVTSPHHTQRRKSQVTCCHLKSQARVERRNRDAWVFAIMPLLVARPRDRRSDSVFYTRTTFTRKVVGWGDYGADQRYNP